MLYSYLDFSVNHMIFQFENTFFCYIFDSCFIKSYKLYVKYFYYSIYLLTIIFISFYGYLKYIFKEFILTLILKVGNPINLCIGYSILGFL